MTTESKEKPPKQLGRQVGGDHYRQGSIQPVEYIHANNLGYLEGCVIKYVHRHNSKGTGLEDLQKAKHYLEILMKFKYDYDA